MLQTLSLAHVLAVAAGSAVGGVARWLFGLWLNPLWPSGFPVGTLAVNVIGGVVIGAVLAWQMASPNELWRLLLVTGFCGGFTTFSAFSAESLLLVQSGRLAFAFVHTLTHVLGALGGAALGWRLMRLWLD